MAAKDTLGRRGEDLAVAWAQEQGWSVLARNWRGERGEIDVVARDGDCLVVLEVKTRSSMALGGPLAAVTPRKLARLRLLTGEWLARADEAGSSEAPGTVGRARRRGGGASDVRIDVLGIVWPDGVEPSLVHVRGVG